MRSKLVIHLHSLDHAEDLLSQFRHTFAGFPSHAVGQDRGPPQEQIFIYLVPDGQNFRLPTLHLKGDESIQLSLWPFFVKKTRADDDDTEFASCESIVDFPT